MMSEREKNNFFEEPVVLPLEDWIDLHTFSPKEIPDLLNDYLSECHRAGLKKLRIIHGKGIGVQREIVRTILKKCPLVDTFFQAPPEEGGWGATIALLKKK